MQREHAGARAVHRSEDGFTLLELMMVILIIAILIAVLMPVVAGAQTRAKDRAAQSTLDDAVKAAKVVYTDKQDYTQATPAALTAAIGAGSLLFVDDVTAPSTNKTVSVAPVSQSYVVLGTYSKSGSCFYVSDDATAGTMYAKMGGAGGCAASGAPLPGDPAWKTQW